MDKYERNKHEMLLRVRDFGSAHVEQFPESSPGGQAFQDVAHAVEQIETHTVSQSLGSKQGREDVAVARAALRQEMRLLARTGRSLRKTDLSSGWSLRMPSHVSDKGLLKIADEFLKDAEPHREALVRLGLPATFPDDLRAASDALEAARAIRRDGRSGVAAAAKAIDEAFAHASRALATLDIVVPNAIEKDVVLFARWMRDRVVVNPRHKRPSTDVKEGTHATTVDKALPQAS